MNQWGWTKDFTDTAESNNDVSQEADLTPLGSTNDQLTTQLAEAYTRPQTWLVKQYIAEAKRRLARLSHP